MTTIRFAHVSNTYTRQEQGFNFVNITIETSLLLFNLSLLLLPLSLFLYSLLLYMHVLYVIVSDMSCALYSYIKKSIIIYFVHFACICKNNIFESCHQTTVCIHQLGNWILSYLRQTLSSTCQSLPHAADSTIHHLLAFTLHY